MRRWLIAAGLLLVALVLAGRADRPSAAPAERPASPPPAPRVNPEPSAPSGETADRPLRDPFRYADEATAVERAPVRRAPPTTSPPIAAPDPPVRLVGLVRQSGGLRAVLAIHGELVLLRPGEASEGWTLVAVDEAEARLRGPDGHEETLPLPEQ